MNRLTPVLTSAIRMVPKNVYQSGDRRFIYKSININIYIKKRKQTLDPLPAVKYCCWGGSCADKSHLSLAEVPQAWLFASR